MSKKLLLADDSITIQKVIGITFANEDYDLTVVGDGEAALEKVRAERPDLILADVFMPGRNGYELCAAVKQDPSLRSVPVLLLTGTFEPFDEEKATTAGADGWIAKPFESQALIDRVEELLSRPPEPAASGGSPEAGAPLAVPAAEGEDIWADLSNFAAPEEESEPAGIEEAFSPVGAVAGEGDSSSAPLLPEDDIWQSLGEELPAEGEGIDPFAFTEPDEERPAAEVIDPFDDEAAGAAEEGGEPEFEEEWAAAAAEPSPRENDDTVWELFEEDDEILALDESDILEEELEIPEDENLAAIVASMEGEEEGAGPPVADEEPDGDFPATELVWESDLEEAGAEEEEFPPLERESFVTGAAGDFLAAEAAGDDPFEEMADDPARVEAGSAGEPEEPFAAETVYAFSLEDEEPLPLPAASRLADEPLRSAPAALAEEKVAALTDAEIERIVEKVAGSVIERLAQTMLERIAWEVVPDLAESMIKEEIRRIREEVQ